MTRSGLKCCMKEMDVPAKERITHIRGNQLDTLEVTNRLVAAIRKVSVAPEGVISRREGDSVIMDCVWKRMKQIQECKVLNKCRIYLRAMMWSDIV